MQYRLTSIPGQPYEPITLTATETVTFWKENFVIDSLQGSGTSIRTTVSATRPIRSLKSPIRKRKTLSIVDPYPGLQNLGQLNVYFNDCAYHTELSEFRTVNITRLAQSKRAFPWLVPVKITPCTNLNLEYFISTSVVCIPDLQSFLVSCTVSTASSSELSTATSRQLRS
jgi:hypothetical protein